MDLPLLDYLQSGPDRRSCGLYRTQLPEQCQLQLKSTVESISLPFFLDPVARLPDLSSSLRIWFPYFSNFTDTSGISQDFLDDGLI
jgi:hypothetical protein